MNKTHRISTWIQKSALLAAGFLAAATLALALLITTVFAGGPANRPTYTSASPANQVVFNAITDNPEHGDERNFVLIREAGKGTYKNEIKLEPGKEYEVYSYYHNNAKPSLNVAEGNPGMARNARIAAHVPTVVKPGERGKITSTISADNAEPKRVWDEAYVTADSTVALRYVPASAVVHSGGAVNGKVLSDERLFSSQGTFLGYSELNGVLPGCADFAGYVVYRLKVDQPNFDVKKEVSKSGSSEWGKKVTSAPSDKVDFRISYKNTGTTDQNDVTIKDVLPKGLSYVKGTSKLVNASNPNGLSISDNITSENGVNVGNYGKGATAVVTFTAQLSDKSEDLCQVMKNRVVVTTKNGVKEDTAEVAVEGVECEEEVVVPGELPTTGPAQIIAGILGVSLVSLGVAYWIRSRHEYKQALAGFASEFTEAPAERLLEAKSETVNNETQTQPSVVNSKRVENHASRFHKK